MYNTSDNIVALATAVGISAINVIRCSGPETLNIIQKLLPSKKRNLKANMSFVTNIVNPKNGDIVDQSIVTCFVGPKSYTGQNMFEISAHGGPIIYHQIITILIESGCRISEKGEFTYRAFINGKLDLIQAEAISNIVNGDSGLDTQYALDNLSGKLSLKINQISKKIKKLITYIEHELDFNENEITHKTLNEYLDLIENILIFSKRIKSSSFLSKSKNFDYSIAIVGKPNAGKSSLFNCLVGKNRSIVTNISGTTRDTVESIFSINGLSVSLIDTAGLRKTKDEIELKGIERTRAAIKTSNCIVLVDEKNPEELIKEFKLKTSKKDVVLVKNKIDIYNKSKNKAVYNTSCLDSVGIDLLLTHLSTQVKKHKVVFLKENSYIVSKRLLGLLEKTILELEVSKKLLKNNCELTVLVSSLHGALHLLSTNSSRFNKNEIINSIFKGFCVGK